MSVRYKDVFKRAVVKADMTGDKATVTLVAIIMRRKQGIFVGRMVRA